MNNRLTTMVEAYIEAIYFTETGDIDQPPKTATLTPYCLLQCYLQCRNFHGAVTDAPALDGWKDMDWRQIGHDLWLTRNGHGVGFWARPEIYGEANAMMFTRLARAMGTHDADFGAQE